METPINTRSRPQRTPTPKLSERKKALFTSGNKSPINEELDVAPLDGSTIISPKGSSKYVIDKCLKKNSRTRNNRLSNDATNITNNDTRIRSNLFDNDELFFHATSSTSTSRETSYSPKEQSKHPNTTEKNNKSGKNSLYKNTKSTSAEPLLSDEEMNKISEATGKIRKGGTLQKNPKRLCTDELRNLFKDRLNIQSANGLISPKDRTNSPRSKRPQSNSLVTESPKRKYPKIDENNQSSEEIAATKSVDEVRISTKSFYSNQFKKSPITSVPKQKNFKLVNSIKKKSPNTNKTVVRKLFNKGVSHKIKRQNTQKNLQKMKSIEEILETIRSSKLKSLPSKRLEREKIDELHKIFKNNQNPIEMARPLKLRNDQSLLNFSSSDEDEYDFDQHERSTNNQDTVSEKLPQETVRPEKKFFKSGESKNRNEFKINNLTATMSNGKLKIIPDKKKKRRKINRYDESFSVEQAQVNDIIKNLDSSQDQSAIEQQDENLKHNENSIPLLGAYSAYRKRLPYQTSDPELIERQHLLLDFLISYDICNEENFKIFIADPDNHKAEAARIVDSLIIVVPDENATTDSEIPMNNDLIYDIGSNEDVILNIEQEGDQSSEVQINLPNDENLINNIDIITHDEANKKILHSNEVTMEVDETTTNSLTPVDGSNENVSDNSKKLFPLFHSGKYQKILNKSTRSHQQRKAVWRGTGQDQYQIDAGQKEFGAKLCNKCGLVYTAHEAEEEQLHLNFHNSLQILKFNGWITEDVIDMYPSISGMIRIIQVTEFSHIKQRERILDVLKIVDTELGFITTGLPAIFSAYLAVKKTEIVGFCLTHPLKIANRFVLVNETECCTEETFDVKCGLYRIWVSPLNRRLKIGTKLFRTVKKNAVLGGVNVDDIAFNAPTEDGQLFARKVSNRTDFLVYQ